jgi:hypothetical protein
VPGHAKHSSLSQYGKNTAVKVLLYRPGEWGWAKLFVSDKEKRFNNNNSRALFDQQVRLPDNFGISL